MHCERRTDKSSTTVVLESTYNRRTLGVQPPNTPSVFDCQPRLQTDEGKESCGQIADECLQPDLETCSLWPALVSLGCVQGTVPRDVGWGLLACVRLSGSVRLIFPRGPHWQYLGRKILLACSNSQQLVFVGCLMSQQHVCVSQGRICSDNFT